MQSAVDRTVQRTVEGAVAGMVKSTVNAFKAESINSQ